MSDFIILKCWLVVCNTIDENKGPVLPILILIIYIDKYWDMYDLMR